MNFYRCGQQTLNQLSDENVCAKPTFMSDRPWASQSKIHNYRRRRSRSEHSFDNLLMLNTGGKHHFDLIMKSRPDRKRQLSPIIYKRRRANQKRGINVDTVTESDSKDLGWSVRVVSFQEFSSGWASMSRLRDFSTQKKILDGLNYRSKIEKDSETERPNSSKTSFLATTKKPLDSDEQLSQKEPVHTSIPLSRGLPTTPTSNFEFSYRSQSPPHSEMDEIEKLNFSTCDSSGRWSSNNLCMTERSEDFTDCCGQGEQTEEDTSSSKHSVSWCSEQTSSGERILYKSKNDVPTQVDTVFVAFINRRSGNRFNSFPLNTRLDLVTLWLGENLPVVTDSDKQNRCFEQSVSLAEALGNKLTNVEKQGVAFFVGPAEGKVCYIIQVCDIDHLKVLYMQFLKKMKARRVVEEDVKIGLGDSDEEIIVFDI